MADQQLIVYSTSWCGDCRRSKAWLRNNNVPFTDIDIDQDEAAAAVVIGLNDGSRTIPTIVFPDGAMLVEPSNRELALQVERSLGISTPDAARAHPSPNA